MTVHIGCGAGFAGDRFDAAMPILTSMARREGPKYLIYEVLAERTLAVAQRLRQEDPDAGYSPYLDAYLGRSLAEAKRLGVRIVTNMGAANPVGAARRVRELSIRLGIDDLRIAAVTGDDLLAYSSAEELAAQPTMEGIAMDGRPLLAANAYLGARGIASALAKGADIVLVGRTTDSALALGPLIHEYRWGHEDWDRLAAGTICGHLLECGGQVSGTYFADPGFKDVADLARAGFPIAEVESDGSIAITKPEGTGGLVSPATVTEQLLYEMHDPAAYLVADCVADVTEVELTQAAENRVEVSGVRGHPAPPTLKATVCMENGWLAEAEMTYAGPNALARAELAGEVVEQRLGLLGVNAPCRVDVLGTGSVLDGGDRNRRRARNLPGDGEYRMRIAASTLERSIGQTVIDEVQSLYCSGPAAGGGFRAHLTAQIATASILIPREIVEPRVEISEC